MREERGQGVRGRQNKVGNHENRDKNERCDRRALKTETNNREWKVTKF